MPEGRKKCNKKCCIIALICICGLFLTIVCAFIFLEKKAELSNKNLNTETITTTVNEELTAESSTSEVAQTETVAPVKFPKELNSVLEENGVSVDDLEAVNCRQLVIVEENQGEAIIKFFEQEKRQWRQIESASTSAFIGKNGITKNKTEGDGCTPVGFYRIGSAFYINEKPETGLDSFQINDQSYWVDDSDSAFYNQYVVGTAQKDWNSAERMIEYNGYRYGFVVDYNPDCEPGLGSAIFFHIGYNPTAGCIATDEEAILNYLSLLDKEKNPFVIIG